MAICTELVTTVMPGTSSSCRASVQVVVPADRPTALPGRTIAAATRAMASFSVRSRADFASNPGSSVLVRPGAVAPP